MRTYIQPHASLLLAPKLDRHMASSNEQDAAAAAATQPRPEVTLFDKIVAKQIPADIIYEDDL
jgi:hypothetical protein